MFSSFRGTVWLKARISEEVLAVSLAKLQETKSNIFPRVNQMSCLWRRLPVTHCFQSYVSCNIFSIYSTFVYLYWISRIYL